MGDLHLQASILDINFIRPGSLSLTPRSLDQSPQWESDEVRTIEVSLGLGKQPHAFRVRRFVPGPGDAVSRTWVAPDGNARSIALAPYALADYADTKRSIQENIRDNCMCFSEAVRFSHPAIRKVYAEVGCHLDDLRAVSTIGGDPVSDGAGVASGPGDDPLRLLEMYTELWFGIRNTMGSAWISGAETLGMQPIDEEGYPLRGKVSVPRQVVQVVGCLLDQFLKPLQYRFLTALKASLESEGGTAENLFYTVFLLVFVLLHECEDISKDRERYARQNFMENFFSLPQYVEALHKGARVLVDHWLDFSEGLGVDWSSLAKLRKSLSFIPVQHRDFVVDCYDLILHQTNPPVRASPSTWTKDLCFVSHMFGAPWEANATYDMSDPRFV